MSEAVRKKIVTRIPADKPLNLGARPNRKLRVAAYCRVSTDSEDQLNSYYNQKEYYTNKICSNENWEFAGIYADEGITGTLVKKRDDFLRMIDDCKKGKIDMILIKSISRFARNIVDSLSYIRLLRRMNISIFFEEQNIDSLKEDSETFIGIYSVMAQAESENISANVKWGIAKRMENGTYCGNMNMYGYRRDKVTKEVYIVPEEAEVVRNIYRFFLDGMSALQIKKYLEENKIKTYYGNDKWGTKVVLSILKNEKYCGDVLYQKTYCVDCLTKKKKANHGDLDKFLVTDDHEAIVSRDLYNSVQHEIARRNALRDKKNPNGANKGRYSAKHALSELLICDDCDAGFRRKSKKYGNGEVKFYWRCISRLTKNGRDCSNSKGLEEEALKRAVCRALSRVLVQQEGGLELVKSNLIYAASGNDVSNNLYRYDSGISEEQNRLKDLATLASKSGGNQANYMKAIADCNSRIAVLKEKKRLALEELCFNEAAQKEVDRIQAYLDEGLAVVDEFHDATVRRVINCIRVTKDMNLIIYVKGGLEIIEPYVA